MQCDICTNEAVYSLKARSMFQYRPDAFYFEGDFCLIHFSEQLMRLYKGLNTATPSYEALSTRTPAPQINANSGGTYTIVKREEDMSLKEITLPAVREEVVEAVAEPVKEEVDIARMTEADIRRKAMEEQIKHLILEEGMNNSYDIAGKLGRSRGTVWHAIIRLGLRDKLAPSKNKKGYGRLSSASASTDTGVSRY